MIPTRLERGDAPPCPDQHKPKREHVSLDAQDWVWNHSQSKGTARLVLLAIADKAYGKGCTAYAGTTMLVQRSNAARSSVVAAVDKLIELGELAVVDGQQGPRGETVYTLPKARRHRRSTPEGGPDSGPVQIPDRSENRTGTDSGPGGSENRTPGGPKSGPHNARNTNTNHPSAPEPGPGNEQEGQQDRIPRAFDYIQPLIKAMGEAGIRVSWQMAAEDIQAIAVVQQRAGVKEMVTFARNIKGRAREPITHATYFLKSGWRGLPPQTEPRPDNEPEEDTPPWCGDPDCDERTRLRQREDDNGLRALYRCPQCHPDRKDPAA
ncbi:hypothetical protein [Streptomyces sp. NPDC005799]|uniref:hypothetical protein n=1 Tax=Streptomyces sp. NPDC005799 TaxID=3154678 RepID=UPI0033D6F683